MTLKTFLHGFRRNSRLIFREHPEGRKERAPVPEFGDNLIAEKEMP
jgi:hypothetical protein